MSLAWYVEGLTPAQKAVLVALADHATDDGRHVYPGAKRIATKTSYTTRTVRRALADLREMGLIVVIEEASHHRPTEYEIDLTECQARQARPDTESGHDLTEDPERPDRGSPKPSVNHQEEPSGDPPTPPFEPEVEHEIPGMPPDLRPPNDVEFPDGLRNPDFLELWWQYERHRDQIGRPLSTVVRQKQLDRAAEVGVEAASWLINQTLENGWQGLIWERLAERNGARASPNGRHEGEPAGFAGLREYAKEQGWDLGDGDV